MIRKHNVPLFWGLMPMVAGLLLDHFSIHLWTILSMAVIASIGLAVLGHFRSILVVLVFFSLGYGVGRFNQEAAIPLTSSKLFQIEKVYTFDAARTTAHVVQWNDINGRWTRGAGVWLTIRDLDSTRIRHDQYLVINASPVPINFSNQLDAGFNRYRRQQGVNYEIRINRTDVEMIEWSGLPSSYLITTRQAIQDKIDASTLNHSGKGLVSALILGDKSRLSTADKRVFSEAGVAHALAVSGMHIGLVYLIILGAFKLWSKQVKPWMKIAGLMAIWLFVLMSGAPISAIRSGIMITCLVSGQLLSGRQAGLSGWCLAGMIILACDPSSLFDLGFQLSFIAVLAILLFHQKICAQVTVNNYFLQWIWQGTVLSVIAQVSVLPLIWLHFGTIAPIFLVANLIVALCLPLLMVLSILWLIFGYVGLAGIMSWVTTWFLERLFETTQLSNGPLVLPSIDHYQLTIISLLCLIALSLWAKWRFTVATLASTCLCLLGLTFNNPQPLAIAADYSGALIVGFGESESYFLARYPGSECSAKLWRVAQRRGIIGLTELCEKSYKIQRDSTVIWINPQQPVAETDHVLILGETKPSQRLFGSVRNGLYLETPSSDHNWPDDWINLNQQGIFTFDGTMSEL